MSPVKTTIPSEQTSNPLARDLGEQVTHIVVEPGQLWFAAYLVEAGRYFFGVIVVSLVLFGLLKQWSLQ